MSRAIYVDDTKVKRIYIGDQKIKKVYVDDNLVWTSSIAKDQGLNMDATKLVLGNGAHNPISGGTTKDWTLLFSFVWKSAKGGTLMYHNYNQRESIIKLMSDGRIMVNANRYDTNNNKTWYSTKLCRVGCFNQVAINRSGQIYINGENATPSIYGGDMPLWGEVSIFPDRDINATCLGIQGWNWNLGANYIHITAINWPYETDPSNFSMNFNENLVFKYNTLGGALKSTTGNPIYENWEWNEEREAFQ